MCGLIVNSGIPNLVCAVAAVGALLSVMAPAPAAALQVETVESESMVWSTSVQVDSASYPHIAYVNLHLNDLRYAYRDGDGWHAEIVYDWAVASSAGVALDADGAPNLCCYQSMPGYYERLIYFSPTEAGWDPEVVDASHGFASLALDGAQSPCLSYLSYGTFPNPDRDLRFAQRDAAGWLTETVDSEGDVGLYTSLAFDDQGRPHISYFDNSQGDLAYACRTGLGWTCIRVDVTGTVGQHTSLALDPEGFPHVSYYDVTNSALKYAHQDAVGWHIDIVDNNGDVGQFSSIALDCNGLPHVSYYDATDLNLKYACKREDGWHVRTLDSEATVGLGTSIALSTAGLAHISYGGFPESVVKYAYVDDITISGELGMGLITLRWDAVPGAHEYWVYGAANLPWFQPGAGPAYAHRVAVLPSGATEWSNGAGVGDPLEQWTYLLRVMRAGEEQLAISNRIGEHDFAVENPDSP